MSQQPRVSGVTGHRQARALEVVTLVAAGAAAGALLLPGRIGEGAGFFAVGLVTVTPLLRVAWLVFRWGQEGDRRFVLAGLGLLGVVVAGSLATLVLGR